MKSRILLIGKTGQIGSELVPLLPELGETVAVDRRELDLSKNDDIRRIISRVRPRLLINAAAYTAVDQAEKDQEMASLVNAAAPGIMAEEASLIGAGLIHYSTDYVFDGLKTSPYEESVNANPLNIYGKTKLAGEVAIKSTGVPHLIFRTAWVYSTSGKNFLLTILRLATQRQELRIVQDQFGAPTWSREVATTTVNILHHIAEQQKSFDLSTHSGTYHMTAAGVTTWYEFARAILEEASAMTDAPSWLGPATAGLPLNPVRIIPIATDQYPTPARRPAYSVLSNLLLRETFNIDMRDWRAQLHDAFRDEPLVREKRSDPV
jgi:dTDP-4-dehydrorhamnose reductase